MAKMHLDPVHLRKILLEEFFQPMKLRQNQLVRQIGASLRRINEFVLGKRQITTEAALRLDRHLKMSPQVWLGLQMDSDLDVKMDRLGDRFKTNLQRHRRAG